jgi:drug/metabolite transporter (DMT)-like permease
MKDSLLYVLTIIIWGSTWIGIKFQLGTVDPMVSVVYRFALSSVILAISLGKSFDFSMTLPYVSSLFYLAVFGSIIAFTSYLTLIRSLGADKASYSIMVVPVVALIISSFVEGYVWSFSAIAGLILVVGGNFLALHRPSPKT